AGRGHAGAMANLGNAYAEGDGRARNMTEAIRWWQLAAGKDQPQAQYRLGHQYYLGENVAQDLRARANGAPPLNDVTVIPAGENGPMRVVVRVPEEQPPGLYQGLILDQRTDAPFGVLGVRLGQR
ncbi:MAG: sel1 repeat family protein, partial [Rhizobiales bacterium]|nr:sel1 repeat family protein [Hyphomicrobiales bacterium]